jgi:hypothetical protein
MMLYESCTTQFSLLLFWELRYSFNSLVIVSFRAQAIIAIKKDHKRQTVKDIKKLTQERLNEMTLSSTLTNII